MNIVKNKFLLACATKGLTMPDPEHKRYLCDSTPAEIIITIEIGLI